MAEGRALIIGVNHVDSSKYRGWEGPLTCPENDARAMEEITTARGFKNTILLTSDATASAVTDTIKLAADELGAGDTFLMYYSGHGNSIKDKSGDEWQDMRDETLCLYDDQLLDDELYSLWPRFADGVRVVVVADSCHSGSITRNAIDDDLVVRAMDERSAHRLLRENPDRYADARRKLPMNSGRIGASVLLISGCQEHQQSFERKSTGHGQMTAALMKTLKEDNQSRGYAGFFDSLLSKMPEIQTPNLLLIGAPNEDFNTEPPFTI